MECSVPTNWPSESARHSGVRTTSICPSPKMSPDRALGTTAVSCTGSCHSQDRTCHPASARSRSTCPPPFPPLGLLVTLGDYVYGASALSISDSQMRSVLLPLRYSPELVTPVNRTPSQPSRLFPASATLAYGPTYYLRSVGCYT